MKQTSHTVSVLPQGKLLLGRRLNDKLPRVTIPSDKITETHWQQLLRKRDVPGKLRQEKYADGKRQHNTVIM